MNKHSDPLSFSGFPEETVIGLASPQDRLAAAILDVVLLFPLVHLIQAPVKRGMTETFLLGGDPNPWLYWPFSLGSFIVLFVLYHSLMIRWKGQTLGKMFFKIRVIPYNNGRLDLSCCFSRSLAMVMECFLMGYPFLALFSHPLRRPIHDRVADSLVIGLKNPISCPGPKEKWRSYLVGNIQLVLIVALGLNHEIITGGQQSDTVALGEQNRCRAMKKQNGSELETVLQLYLSHKVGRPCLLEVARASLWKKENSGLAKLSLAFALGNDSRLSNKYLEDVCQGKSAADSACAFSTWLLELKQVDRQSLDRLYSLVNQFDFNNSLRVMAAGFFRTGGQFERTTRVLKPLQSNQVLQPLVAGLLFHSLLGQKKWSEAFWIYRSQASIDSRDILRFLEMEKGNREFDRKEKLAMFDFFFPQLRDHKKTNRWPSSSQVLDSHLVETYGLLSDSQ